MGIPPEFIFGPGLCPHPLLCTNLLQNTSSLAAAQTSGNILSVMKTAEWNELNSNKYL